MANDCAQDCLRDALRHCQQHLPFRVDALVMLPDHIHAIWTLPPDDCVYSKRWGVIKKHFAQHWLASGGAEQSVTASRLRYRRRGIWQRRFRIVGVRSPRIMPALMLFNGPENSPTASSQGRSGIQGKHSFDYLGFH